MSTQPNILVLVNDHQAYYRHGWDGGVRPLTPHFDRLAREGMRFDRAYCGTPLCGPNRRTLLTGLYTHNHGNYYNYTNAPYDHEVYLDNLAEAGYKNFYFGKWHAGEGTALDFASEGFSDEDYGNPYTTPEYQRYLEELGLPPAEHYVEKVFWVEGFEKQFPNLQEDSTYQCDGYWCGEHAVGLTLTPKETHESFFLANLACDQLEKIACSSSEQPFHLRVDFWGPHQPHFPTREFADLYQPEDIPEYGSFLDSLKNKPAFFRKGVNRPLVNENGDFLIPSPLPWSEWQKIIARAYAHITMVDAAGGQILDKLEELGLSENTLVIWTADHGDALASHGGRFDKGSYMTEEVIRVPLAARYPGQIQAGQTSRDLVSSVDLPPTLLEAAGTSFDQEVDGRSLFPLFHGDHEGWRSSLLVETYGHGFGHHLLGRGVLWKQYKYLYYQDQLDELYDLEKDPFELDNLITNENYQSVKETMHALLLTWVEKTNDPDFGQPIGDQILDEDTKQLRALFSRRGLEFPF